MVSRDGQRGRVYAAESSIEAQLYRRGLVEVLDGSRTTAQAYVDRVIGSPWWAANAPIPSRDVVVGVGRGHVSGAYVEMRWSVSVMVLGPAARYWPDAVTPAPVGSLPVILHEIAHLGVPESAPFHGQEFARLLLGLYGRWLGDEPARMLRRAFVAHKVRHRAAPMVTA